MLMTHALGLNRLAPERLFANLNCRGGGLPFVTVSAKPRLYHVRLEVYPAMATTGMAVHPYCVD